MMESDGVSHGKAACEVKGRVLACRRGRGKVENEVTGKRTEKSESSCERDFEGRRFELQGR